MSDRPANSRSSSTQDLLSKLSRYEALFELTGVINAAAKDTNLNLVSAPHILTSDNEEAEIKIGNNIPIITGRTSNATGNVNGLSQAVNVDRHPVGPRRRARIRLDSHAGT